MTETADVQSGATGRHLLSLAAEIATATSVESVASSAIEMVEKRFEEPVAALWQTDGKTATVAELSTAASGLADYPPSSVPGSSDWLTGVPLDSEPATLADNTIRSESENDSLSEELVVPVAGFGVLCVGWTERGTATRATRVALAKIATVVAAAISRIDREVTAEANRKLRDRVTSRETDTGAIAEILSLGCEYFEADSGVLSRLSGGSCEVEGVAGDTGLVEPGDRFDYHEPVCTQTVADSDGETVGVANIADTEHNPHPIVDDEGAYIGTPVSVDGERYGIVEFVSKRPRDTPFRPNEREFAGVIAQYLGTAIEQERRRIERQRYETILDTVVDPVYALDESGQFTYVNDAAARQFGYGSDVLGEDPSIGMDQADIERVRADIRRLRRTDDQSVRHVFDLETSDGDSRIVENHLALVEAEMVGGTAGVLRDITQRERQRRQYREFKRAVEAAADGIAILDNGEFVFVDETHVEMYGYDDTSELLGETWHTLYGDSEVERLETEAFPALAEHGTWNGLVTGLRPNGSTFPVSLSLTRLDDERLVCTVRDETEKQRRQRELELKERAMDEASVAIQITDATRDDNPLIYVNDHFESVTGYAREDALGRNPRFLQGSGTDPQTVSRLRTAIAAHEPVSAEIKNYRNDGTAYWCQLSVTPIYDDDGEVVNYIGIQQDRTERRARERAVTESRERYETLLQAAPDPVFLADAETGKIVETNTAAADLLGYPREEIVGLHQSDLHPESDADLYREGFQRAVAHSETVSKLPDGSQLHVVTASGEEIPVEIGVRTVSLPDGLIIYGVFRDITERRERERELELKERAMDEANVGITISDPDGDDNPLVYVNEGFVEQTGYSREEVLKTNCRFLQGDDRDQGGLQRLRDAIGEEHPVTVDLRNYRKDGTQYWNRLSVTPVYEDGDLVNYIGIQQDVTEEKLRQRRLEALQQTATDLLDTDDKEAAITVAFEAVQADLEIEIAGAYLCEEDELVRIVTTDETEVNAPERVERGVTPLWEPLENGDPVFYEPTDGLAHVQDEGISLGLFPVGTHGVFIVGTTDQRGLNASERQFVEILLSDLESVLDTIQRQKELFEEREQFRHLTESVEEYGFLVADEDGAIAIWNNGAAALFGYDEDDAVGMNLSALHTASARESERTTRLLKQARIGGESAHEGWLVREDGSEFYADVRYAPLGADADIVSGYAVIVRDMTTRRNQRRRTERFVEESTDVVSVLDTDGTLTYVSGSVDRIFGYDPDTLIGENLFDYIHPENQAHAMEVFYGCVDGSDGAYQAECRFQAADGEWRNVDGQCRNLVDDDAIEGILLYLRDVTETKQRARRFESIFNQTFQFTGLLNPDGTVLEANEATFDLGGFDRESIIGDPIWEAPWFSHSETAQTRARDACGRAARGQFSRYETDVSGSDGIKTIDFSLKPVTNDDGDVTLLVAEGRDITEHQQRRQHLTVLERVLRHNIRNDLTVLRGWTEQLRDEAEPAKRAVMYGTVKRILDKWESMTKRTAQIRQILEVEPSPMDVTTLVKDTSDWAHSQYPDATIEADTGDVSNPAVLAVVSEAVRELIDNAVSATARDPEIDLMLAQPSEDWVEFVVTDTGPGLPDTEVDVLETGEETQLRHGQGLGLWMVRMVVRQTGGNITVKVTETGTTVRLRIPTV